MTTSDLSATGVDTDLVLRAGEAAAAVLPATTPLEAMVTQPGSDHVTAPFAGAAMAELTTEDGTVHRVGVLVGSDLVSALANSPLGGLDVGAAVQPAVDAAAAVLGARASATVTTELALMVSDLDGPFTVVPMVGDGIEAALLVVNTLAPGSQEAPVAAAEAETVVLEKPATATPAEPDTALSPAEMLANEITEPAPAIQQQDPQPVQPRPSVTSRITQPPVAAAPTAPMTVVHQQFTPETAQMFADTAPSAHRGIEMLAGVDMEVTVELGRTRMAVRDLLALSPGTVLELDRAADGPADLLVNGRLIARGEIVVVDEDFGLRITEIVEDTTA